MEPFTADRSTVDQRGAVFDEVYYRTGCGRPYSRDDHWLNFFGGIAAEIVRSLQPASVFDAGCGMGMLVESLWDRGVEASGVDISSYAISQVRPDIRPHCRVGSLTEPIGGPYDLITCIEVVEHMPEQDAQVAVANLTRASDRILFSSTPSDFTEPTHINVRPIIYWLNLFVGHGFRPELMFDASFIAPHSILFSRRPERAHPARAALGLYSDLLRLRSALAEREQRLRGYSETQRVNLDRTGELQREIAARKESLRTIRETVVVREAEVGRLSAELAAARQKTFARAVELAHAGARRAEERGEALRRVEAELTSARQAAAAARLRELELAAQASGAAAERDRLRQEVEKHEARLGALEAERDALVASAGDLRQDAAHMRQALAHVVYSPGWQAILKYRRWLWGTYSRSKLIRLWYEPVAQSIVRKLVPAEPYNAGPAAPVQAPERSLGPVSTPQSFSYERWIELAEANASRLAVDGRMGAQFAYRPKISVVVPVYKISLAVLKEMVDSVRRQTYDHWELCVTHGDPEDERARRYLAAVAQEDPRIRVEMLARNEGISGNSNRALELCTGEFIALLDHDDTLAPFALFEVVKLLNDDPSLDFIYSDKDHISEDGKRLDPLFKPCWSPDTMLSANYLTHLCVARTTEVRSIGGWRPETDGAQDWDLFLRLSERSARIARLPKVLYHWRRIASSVASRGLEAKPYAAQAQLRTLREHFERRGVQAEPDFTSSGLLHVGWRGPRPSISIIAVTGDSGNCTVFEWLSDNGYADVEVLTVASGANPVETPRGKGWKIAGGSQNSLAERLNAAARQATGEVLVFVDAAVAPASTEWLNELVQPLSDRQIGVVGGKLFDAQTSCIRHAGIAFDHGGSLIYPFAGEHDYVWGPFGSANWYRNWLAVSGSCFSTRRDLFLEAGGFSRQPEYPRLDVDYCLRLVVDHKLRILFNPFARMWQSGLGALEQWINADDAAGSSCVRQHFPEGDPYFSPNLACAGGSIGLRRPEAAQPISDHNFSGEARALVRMFDCTPEDIQASMRSSSGRTTGEPRRITWFIPQFGNPFYGGIHTILRFADYFRRAHEARPAFVVLGARRPARVAAQIAMVSKELAAASDIYVASDHDALDRVAPSDASIATLWTTAYYQLRYNRTGRKFYFMQDYEPLFYPAGSTSALVEATYRFGFDGICNTAPLRDLYIGHGGQAASFDPCVDREVFFEPGQKRPCDPYVLFCYARPLHSRNCFELLAEALRKVKRKMGDKVAILTAGEEWNPAAFDLGGVVHNLGLLSYRSTGAVYRMAHAGLSMMMTCHPSYLPLELMACGSMVVTNRNEHTGWLLRDRENCLLAETSAGSMAEAVEEALRNDALREQITRNAAEMVRARYQNWDEQAEKVYQYIASRL